MLGEREPLRPPLPRLLALVLGREPVLVLGRVLAPLPGRCLVDADGDCDARLRVEGVVPADPRPPWYPRAWSFVTRFVPGEAPYFCAVFGFL